MSCIGLVIHGLLTHVCTRVYYAEIWVFCCSIIVTYDPTETSGLNITIINDSKRVTQRTSGPNSSCSCAGKTNQDFGRVEDMTNMMTSMHARSYHRHTDVGTMQVNELG